MNKPLITLTGLQEGVFLERHNRFAGEIKYNGKIESAHIHDPGRLKELLNKGVKVLFTESKGKLTYYIKAVRKDNEWVLIDSALHSKIAEKVIKSLPEFSNVQTIKKEIPIGNSRIDFVLDGTPLEVKGVSLIKGDTALFPDAPTKRGTRHVEEIIKTNGIIMFLIFREAKKFAPNEYTDTEFAQKLSEARAKGIKILPIQLEFDGKTVFYKGRVNLAEF